MSKNVMYNHLALMEAMKSAVADEINMRGAVARFLYQANR